jgi:hypothetical protein
MRIMTVSDLRKMPLVRVSEMTALYGHYYEGSHTFAYAQLKDGRKVEVWLDGQQDAWRIAQVALRGSKSHSFLPPTGGGIDLS